MKMGNPNAGGGVGGVCDGDNLDIAAGATNLVVNQLTPTLCGVNTGQHGNSLIERLIPLQSPNLYSPS